MDLGHHGLAAGVVRRRAGRLPPPAVAAGALAAAGLGRAVRFVLRDPAAAARPPPPHRPRGRARPARRRLVRGGDRCGGCARLSGQGAAALHQLHARVGAAVADGGAGLPHRPHAPRGRGAAHARQPPHQRRTEAARRPSVDPPVLGHTVHDPHRRHHAGRSRGLGGAVWHGSPALPGPRQPLAGGAAQGGPRGAPAPVRRPRSPVR
mmetsp:Transcript_30162/g.97312  ORF Transcript_30162/g.97312 Transcript_30162/m.97312 type:complete len:207 (+) Transcript_30162:113-733(+)